jgi:hypothetical protein
VTLLNARQSRSVLCLDWNSEVGTPRRLSHRQRPRQSAQRQLHPRRNHLAQQPQHRASRHEPQLIELVLSSCMLTASRCRPTRLISPQAIKLYDIRIKAGAQGSRAVPTITSGSTNVTSPLPHPSRCARLAHHAVSDNELVELNCFSVLTRSIVFLGAICGTY